MKSIFISSTKMDLIEHRMAVDAAIRRLEQRPINMDDFGSQPGGASGTSVREVDKGDIYVGILAHRYGYVPAGMDRSVTEQEYDRAVERKLPRLMYLVDPAYAWPDEFIEKNDPAASYSAQEKLNQFKAKVNKAEVRSLFTTPDNLAAQVTADLTKLLDKQRELEQQRLRQQRFFRILFAAVILIGLVILAFISIPDVKNRVVEFAGLASPTFTRTLLPTQTFTPSPTPTPTATPLEGTPFAQGDVGVVFANFQRLDPDAPNTDENIERELQNAGVSFIRVNHELSGREEAQQIARQYNATIVIWGQVSGSAQKDSGGVAVNFEINAPSQRVESVLFGFEVSAEQLPNFNVYVFQGMDINYVINFIRGQIAYFSGDYDGALRYFNSAVDAIRQEHVGDLHVDSLYFYRGTIELLKNQFPAAKQDFDEAINLNRDFAGAYLNRGIVYGQQDNLQGALSDIKTTLDLVKDNPYAYLARGIIKAQQKDLDGALQDIQRVLQLEPTGPLVVPAYVNLGIIYAQRGAKTPNYDYADAIASYQQALALDPNDETALYNLGVAHLRLGDLDAAIQDFTKATQLNSADAEAFNDLGLSYYQQQQYDAAITNFNQAISIDPQHATAYLGRGFAYFGMFRGDGDAATRLEYAQYATADFLQAQSLGVQLPDEAALFVKAYEMQFGTPEATDLPVS